MSSNPPLFAALRIPCAIIACLVASSASQAQQEMPLYVPTPAWWTAGTNPPVSGTDNPLAVANVGQLKNMAFHALKAVRADHPALANRIEARLVGPGKPIRSWDPVDSNRLEAYSVVAMGQLKAVAAPFYEVFQETHPQWLATRTGHPEDRNSPYPWSRKTGDDSNYSFATVGQVKHAFRIDFSSLKDQDADGLSDAWEMSHFSTLATTPDGDQDNDGLSNADEYRLGWSPTVSNSNDASRDLLINGDFSQPDIQDGGKMPKGDAPLTWNYWAGIPGWSAMNGDNVEIQNISPVWPGNPYVELNAHPDSDESQSSSIIHFGIEQAVFTKKGQRYDLYFDCRPRTDSPERLPIQDNAFDVMVNDTVVKSLKFGVSQKETGSGEAVWTSHVVSFVAKEKVSFIRFFPTASLLTLGPFLDNVRLTVANDSVPPQVPSFDEASGMRFRRLGIDGSLISARKEQEKSESDESNEETYVDSLTRQLRHDTSDVYVPLPGGELSLSVKRSNAPEMWSTNDKGAAGENPSHHIRVDRPFGMGWSSSIAPYLKLESYTFSAAPGGASPPAATPTSTLTAIDQNGASFKFYRYHTFTENIADLPANTDPESLADRGEVPVIFLPAPSNRSEISSTFNKLKRVTEPDPMDSNKSIPYFTLTQKFGTVVRYEVTPVAKIDVKLDTEGKNIKHVYYYRAVSATDRFGNVLSYKFGKSGTVIPTEISALNEGSETAKRQIIITLDQGNQVTRISDPKGNLFTYQYETGAFGLPVLKTVESPVGAITKYEYKPFTADDDAPRSSSDASQAAVQFHQLLLGSITSNVGKYMAPDGTLKPIHESARRFVEFRYRLDRSVVSPVVVSNVVKNPQTGIDETVHQVRYHVASSSRPRVVSSIECLENKDGSKRITEFSPGNEDLGTGNWSATELQNLITALPSGKIAPLWLRFDCDAVTGQVTKIRFQGTRVLRVKDGEDTVRTYTYSSPDLVDGSELEKLMDRKSGSRAAFAIALWKKCDVTHPAVGDSAPVSESVIFKANAGLADETVVDYSGNVTTYRYGDAYSILSAMNEWFGNPSEETAKQKAAKAWIENSPAFSGFHSDPTAEIRHLNGSGEVAETLYSYAPKMRVMKSIRDPEGRTTTYEIQPGTGNRLSETVESPVLNTVIRKVSYEYADTRFKGFITKTTVSGVRKASHNDGAFYDHVTTHEPDEFGNLQSDIVFMGSGKEGLKTSHSYDKNGNRTSTTDALNNTTIFTYDGANRLIQTTLPPARQGVGDDLPAGVSSIGYDACGKAIWRKDALGTYSATGHDNLGRPVLEIQMMDVSLPSFTPDLQPEIVATPSQIVTRKAYNRLGSVVRSMDANGVETRTTYDVLQRPTTVTLDPTGLAYKTSFFYNGPNSGGSAFASSSFKPTRKVDPRGFETVVQYDAFYRPVKTWTQYGVAADGTTPTAKYAYSENQYDLVGNLTATKVFRSPSSSNTVAASGTPLTTTTEYDSLNRPKKVTEGLGSGMERVTETDYTAMGSFRTTVTEGGMVRITETDHDLAGRAVRVWSPDPETGRIVRTSPYSPLDGSPRVENFYDANGNIVFVWNAVNSETGTTYNSRNFPIQVWKKLDDVIHQWASFTYDQNGNKIATKDAMGRETRMSYDKANRLVLTKTPVVPIYGKASASLKTSLDLDANGNVIKQTDGAGNSVINQFDAANRLINSVSNSASGDPADPAVSPPKTYDIIVTRQYDASGYLSKVIDGMNQVTSFAHDGMGRKLHTLWDSDGGRAKKDEITDYDALLALQVTDASGQVVRNHYDSRNRLVGQECVGNASHSRTLVLDSVGRISKVLHGGHNLSSSMAVGSDRRNVSHEYDLLDRVTNEFSAGSSHASRYDKAGNQTRIIYATGRKLIKEYDALGRLISIKDVEPPVGENTFSYLTTFYEYDRNDNVILLKYDYGFRNSTVTSRYDELNRKIYQEIKHNSTGDPENLGVTEYRYDAASNLVWMKEGALSKKSIIQQQLTDVSVFPERITVNTYDNVYRLEKESFTNGVGTSAKSSSNSYKYDKANNRIEWIHEGEDQKVSTSTYVYGSATNGLMSNQLASMTGPVGQGLSPRTVTYQYDANGSRIGRSVVTGSGASQQDSYAWTPWKRLKSMVNNSGLGGSQGTYAFEYDHRSRRVWRDESGAGGQASVCSYSGGTSVLEQVGGELAVEYIRGLDAGGGVGGMLYSKRDRSHSISFYNARGDVVACSSNYGSLSYAARYEGFGKRSQEHGSNLNPQRGNTKEEDRSGLLNEGHRYRDLETGMFISRDPAGFVDGPNVYTYVRQNPWTAFDPEGLATTFQDADTSSSSTVLDEYPVLNRSNVSASDPRSHVPKPMECYGNEHSNSVMFHSSARQTYEGVQVEDPNFPTCCGMGFVTGGDGSYDFASNTTVFDYQQVDDRGIRDFSEDAFTISGLPSLATGLGRLSLYGLERAASRFSAAKTTPTFSGTSKPWTKGATPNSIYTHIDPKTGRAVQNAIYDDAGDVVGHLDFKNHGPGAPSGHGHRFPQPGNPASGHGAGKPHIPGAQLPPEWSTLPPGVQPHTPFGQ